MVEEKLTEIKSKLEKLEEKTSKKIPKHIPINWENEKKYTKLQFFLTGFGKFGKHVVNPTTHIINHFKSTNQEKKPYSIYDCRVLEVTTKACQEYFDEIISLMNKQKLEEQNEPLNIVIHFGLYAGSGQFQLETQGKNLANFSIPDMAGQILTDQSICKDFPKTHMFKTTLPVEELTMKISKLFPNVFVKQSQSAGQYICNYIYYISLFHSLHSNFHSIFVHVPEFSEIEEKVQYQFAVALLDEIYQYYSSNILKSS